MDVGRSALNVVPRGTAYGGCPLYRDPAPSAAEIGAAFVSNVLDRARHADVELSAQDAETVRAWFGAAS